VIAGAAVGYWSLRHAPRAAAVTATAAEPAGPPAAETLSDAEIPLVGEVHAATRA
jgi:hypothetical protein